MREDEKQRRCVLAVDDGECADFATPARFIAGIATSPTKDLNARCFGPGKKVIAPQLDVLPCRGLREYVKVGNLATPPRRRSSPGIHVGPRVLVRSKVHAQPMAFFTSETIRASSAAVNSFSA